MRAEQIERYKDDFITYLAQTVPGRKEIVVDSTEGCTIRTADGREYLDMTSGIAVANVGHSNPRVVEAVREMIGRMAHVNVYGRFVLLSQVDLARELASITPGDLTVSFLTNSGTEAVEGALKLARKYTGRPGIVAFEGAFHGRTMGALSVTWKEQYRKPFEPLLPGVRFVPFGDARAAFEAIDKQVGAVIVEPVQGEAGLRLPPPDFLPALRETCTRVGAALIFDEVQGAFGRAGRWFSFEHWDVVPDILVTAKALGGGLPLGAFTASPEVMSTFLDPPLSHLTTFGGNPVSCAAALASIRYIREHRLVERSARLGTQLKRRLDELVGAEIGITAARSIGLWAAVDVASPDLTMGVVREAEQQGVLVGSMLHSGNTIRLAPPLTIGEEDLHRGIDVLARAAEAVLPARR